MAALKIMQLNKCFFDSQISLIFPNFLFVHYFILKFYFLLFSSNLFIIHDFNKAIFLTTT